jgi:hypothetical protein
VERRRVEHGRPHRQQQTNQRRFEMIFVHYGTAMLHEEGFN